MWWRLEQNREFERPKGIHYNATILIFRVKESLNEHELHGHQALLRNAEDREPDIASKPRRLTLHRS